MPTFAGVLSEFKRNKVDEVEDGYDTTDTTCTTETDSSSDIEMPPTTLNPAYARRGVSYTRKKPFLRYATTPK